MDLSGPAYIAIKSRTSSGWLDPGSSPNVSSPPLPCQGSGGSDSDGPPNASHYMPVRSIQARVEREYGGINSSGGPQVSGRSDQSDFVVELSAGKFSPFLYEHCCGGMQLKWVHLAVLQWDDASSSAQLWQHIRMEDVNLTGYKIRGTRFFTQEFTADEVNPLLKAKTFVKYQDYDVSDVGHIDRMTLLYTSISFTVFDSAGALASQNGWTTGSDEPWMSSAAAPAAAPASANP